MDGGKLGWFCHVRVSYGVLIIWPTKDHQGLHGCMMNEHDIAAEAVANANQWAWHLLTEVVNQEEKIAGMVHPGALSGEILGLAGGY